MEKQDHPLHLIVFLQEVVLVVVLLDLVVVRVVDLLHLQVHMAVAVVLV